MANSHPPLSCPSAARLAGTFVFTLYHRLNQAGEFFCHLMNSQPVITRAKPTASEILMVVESDAELRLWQR